MYLQDRIRYAAASDWPIGYLQESPGVPNKVAFECIQHQDFAPLRFALGVSFIWRSEIYAEI